MSSNPADPQTQMPPLTPAYAPKPLPKNPWLAVLFSCMPGLGQVYNGELAKAFVFLSAWVGSIWLTAEGNPFPFAFFIPFVWFFNVIDAWKTATAINQRFLGGSLVEEKPSESPAWGITLVVLGLVFLAHNLGWLDFEKLTRYWPLLLIAAGGYFIYGSIRKRKAEETGDGRSGL